MRPCSHQVLRSVSVDQITSRQGRHTPVLNVSALCSFGHFPMREGVYLGSSPIFLTNIATLYIL